MLPIRRAPRTAHRPRASCCSIFGPKRLPGLGRQLGAGMREFKDSITGKATTTTTTRTTPTRPTALAGRPQRSAAADERAAAAARLGRGRLRAALARPPRHGDRAAADRPRGPAEPRRAPRRAALAADHLRVVVFVVAFGVCLLAERRGCSTSSTARSRRRAFKTDAKTPTDPLRAHGRVPGAACAGPRLASRGRRFDERSAADAPSDPADAQALRRSCAAAEPARSRRPCPPREARQPVTLGVGEPFTATFTVAAYAALLLALPLLLYQAYAFVLPAFSPRGAPGRAAADADGPVPVHRRRRLRATSWCCRPRSTSCRTSTTTPSTSCSRRRTTTASRSSSLVGDGPLLPDAGRDPRAHPRWGSSPRASCAHSRRYAIVGIAVVARCCCRARTRSRC